MIETENKNTLVKKGYKQTKLGWIPEEWEICKLEKILKIGSGKDYKNLQSGNIPVYGTGGYMLSVNDYLYDGESVCIGRKGTIDKPQFLTGKFWTVDTLFYTHSYQNCIPRYIYNVFITIPWKLYNEASGVPSLSKRTIEKIKIKLPPLPEQQKIAQILSTWDKAIALQEQLIAEKQALKKGLMQELLTGKKRFPGFKGEWDEVRLGELAEVKRGAGSQYITYVDGSDKNAIRLIRITDFLSNDPKYILKTDATERFILREGDLLIAGTGATAGISFEIPEDFSGLVFSYNAPRIRVNEKIKKEFLIYYLKSGMILSQQLGLFTGNAQPFLDTKAIRRFRIFLPSLPEQNKIASVLSNCDAEIQNLIKHKDLLTQQKKGLMQQLLTGETRVEI